MLHFLLHFFPKKEKKSGWILGRIKTFREREKRKNAARKYVRMLCETNKRCLYDERRSKKNIWKFTSRSAAIKRTFIWFYSFYFYTFFSMRPLPHFSPHTISILHVYRAKSFSLFALVFFKLFQKFMMTSVEYRFLPFAATQRFDLFVCCFARFSVGNISVFLLRIKKWNYGFKTWDTRAKYVPKRIWFRQKSSKQKDD